MKRKNDIQSYFESYRLRVDEILNKVDLDSLVKTIDAMVTTFKNGNTVYVCGNGGSAATATHMQADFSFFTRYFTKFRPKVRALTDNAAMMTAVGNDTSFHDVFVEQLKGHFEKGDVLICISASGNSENVIRAANYANDNGGISIGFVGFEGGKLLETATISLFTPNPKGDYGPIEDVHMIFNHLIVNYLSEDEEFLLNPGKNKLMSIFSIDLNDKVALITGGTRGIGKAIVELFITAGARLLVTGTKKEEIEALNKTEQTGKVIYLYLDFSVEESVSDFINITLPQYHVDILINNAGINKIDLNIETTDNDFDLLNDVNLKGPYILTREVSKQMKIKGYGRIVNITSIWSVVSRSGRSLYSLTKWGIIGLTKTLSIELAENNILVNSVAPGFTKTDLTKSTNSKEELKSINALIPMKRMAEPIEIANLVAFLSSNLNTYITGQNIVIDGGYTNV